MKTGLAVALATILAAGAASAAGAVERTTTIKVGGLWCASCPYIAAQAIQQAPSAKVTSGEYDPSAQSAVFVVTYDDEKVSPAEIAARPGSYGYESQVVEAAAGGS